VVVCGRTLAPLRSVADEIGGEAAVLDALDERAVDEHARSLERIDISFNAIAHGDVQGTRIDEMDVEDYLRPVVTAVRTNFLTARAAARRMREHGGGVILFFGGEGHPPRGYRLGGLQTAFHAMEAMRRQLAVELGEHGIRTVTLRTGGVPESIQGEFEGKDRLVKSLNAATLTGRSATLRDVGEVAAFVASDRARTFTAATVNVSAGALID
jgi:NAD(P)-dependent dehydrogenase (short-subunit alcohol dehydrogenase family)